MDELNNIKKGLKEKKVIIGTDNTIKKLRKNKVSKVWLSSNVPKNMKDELSHYCSLNNVELIQLNIPNDELGVICKKQFSISVLSMVKSN